MSLKIEHTPQTVNPSEELLCCFDVSKASLSLFAQYRPEAQSESDTCRIEESVPNQTGAIEQLLARLQDLAEETGLQGLRVLAEPTGGFERKLLQTARRLGHETGLISPEHVSKLKTVDPDNCREPAKPTTKTRG